MISSLSFLDSPEHLKRFTELSREEKGEEGDRGETWERKGASKGERATKPVITSLSENGY